MPSTNNLIETWLAVDLCIPGRTRADALADLNDECGTKYGHGHLSRWLRGERLPSGCALRYMARCAVGRVLRDEGIDLDDDEALDRIAHRLSAPEKR